jgi:hypothetical protein
LPLASDLKLAARCFLSCAKTIARNIWRRIACGADSWNGVIWMSPRRTFDWRGGSREKQVLREFPKFVCAWRKVVLWIVEGAITWNCHPFHTVTTETSKQLCL